MVNLIKLIAFACLAYALRVIVRDLLAPKSGSEGARQNTEAPSSTPKDVADALELFNLEGEPSWREVKKAYTETVQLYHPDKVAGMGQELRDVAESKMKSLNAAYSVLQRHYGVKS